MFKHKYIIRVESDTPPQICLGDKIHGATVVALETEQYQNLIDLTWLTKRFSLSREVISTKIDLFNVANTGKKFMINTLLLILKK